MSSAPYPEAKPAEIDESEEAAERYLRTAIDDAREILKVTGLKPKRVIFYTAPGWARTVYAKLAALVPTKSPDIGAAMKSLMQDPDLRNRAAEVQALAKKIVPDIARLGHEEAAARSTAFDERAYLAGASAFLSGELKSRVAVFEADARDIEDPKGRATMAVPWRPAIFVE
ncbi:MAG: hypothetical protein E6K13_05990 [Methanobacteriota archaeon]|nr:MAG: hypothetical protein E6K13_05990 [Euryarchaeota archaeon]